MIEAKIVYDDPRDGAIEVKVGDHHLGIGGRDGDGFCYAHQSFDCVLTPEEQAALNEV